MLDLAFYSGLISSGISLAAPLALAGTGGAFAERSGVLNIGIEGMMLIAAFLAIFGSYFTHNPYFGILLAVIGSTFTALIFGILCISKKLDQIVVGIAINLAALGITNVLYSIVFGPLSYFRVSPPPRIDVGVLAQIPFFGAIIANHSILTLLAIVLPLCGWWVLYKTGWGLTVQAAGDMPEAVDAAGASVVRIQYLCLLISGVTIGIGGAALALDGVRYFVTGMTAGRGFIVIAAHFCGRWNPIKVALFCLLFGLIDSLQLSLQALNVGIPAQILFMLPYVLTIIVMAGLMGSVATPKQLGFPYEPSR